MDQRSEYLIQILEKIGAPLMAAIIHGESKDTPAEDQTAQSAQKMAELLSRTVQTSIDIGKSLNLGNNPEEADSLRVALAALAGPLVAERFKQSSSVPGENDLKQVIASMQAVLAFSENFTPSPENTQRLKDIKATGNGVDANQSTVQFIQAMAPVVNAIAVFPFGQQENLLVQEVTTRLTQKAAMIRENMFGGSLSEDDQKFVELGLMNALAQIYAECHLQETERLSGGDGVAMSLDPVWKAFDVRAAMLEIISSSILPSSGTEQPQSAAPVAPPPPVTPPAAPQESAPPPAVETPPSVPPPATPPAAPAPPESPPAEDNPMAMFAKPKDDTPPTTPPPTTPPAQETPPPAAPPEQAPEQPPEQPPQAPESPPPAEDKKDPPADDQGGSPMSFFKPPSDPDGENKT